MSDENDETDVSDILKYEKKLTKALKKRKLCSDENQFGDLDSKIKKYEKKISKARVHYDSTPHGNSDANVGGETSAQNDPDHKSVDKSGMTLLLFYAYVEPVWRPAMHSTMIEWAQNTLEANGVTGRLRVSREGFNGTLTGPYDGIRNFTSIMRNHPGGWFTEMQDHEDFKYTDNLPIGQMFPKLKVFPVKELVNYGLGLENPPSVKLGAVHLSAKDYHEKMKEPNTVIIDVRNTYEADIGRFTPVEGGAEYIDPKMRVSTEFPLWVKNNIEELKKKQVMMYCTGGIRCERASALVRSLGHDNVYQLKGGIHKYLEAFPEGSDSQWSGKNYTFDKRFAHGAVKASGGSGEGGDDEEEDEDFVEETMPTANESRPRSGSLSSTVVMGSCHGCGVPWEKYRGRKRCPICGVPLLLCPACIENPPPETKCTLCKEDALTGKKAFTKAGHRREVAEAGPVLGGGAAADMKGKKKIRAQHECGMCKENFKSRNALFKHLKETGHQNRKAKKQRVAS